MKAVLAASINRIMDHVESGWNLVIVAGLAVLIVACFVRIPKDRPPGT